MPDTRRPDLRNASAESVLRAASRTASPVRMARAAIVPPNAPTPTISIRIGDLFWRRDVLGLAVSKRPIFLRDFDEADEDVFLSKSCSFVETVRQCLVEALLQLGRAAAVQRDLKE